MFFLFYFFFKQEITVVVILIVVVVVVQNSVGQSGFSLSNNDNNDDKDDKDGRWEWWPPVIGLHFLECIQEDGTVASQRVAFSGF